MYRSMMQVYVTGSAEAVAFYRRAFDAELGLVARREDGNYDHAELDVYGQVLAVSEAGPGRASGNAMQFCLHFGEGHEETVRKIYEALREGAREMEAPLGPCEFSPLMASLVDKFGIYWCVFV